jgi:hypothetical protein
MQNNFSLSCKKDFFAIISFLQDNKATINHQPTRLSGGEYGCAHVARRGEV